MDDTKLRRTLNKVGLRLEDGGKGLIEVGRHLVQIFALIGLWRQPQRDADLVDFGEGLGDVCLGSR